MKTNLTTGIWIVFISGALFIISLFLDWTGGFIVSKGISFMMDVGGTSTTSGLPQLYFITFITTIGCLLLCFQFLKRRYGRNYRSISIGLIILSILGILPFILLPFELKTWINAGAVKFGGWLAIFSVFGLLIGSIMNFIKIRQE